MNYTCFTCKHWENIIEEAPLCSFLDKGTPSVNDAPSQISGECHSNAPTVPANGAPGAVWPTTNHTDHCAAWKIASTKQREAREVMMGIEPTPRQSVRRSTMGRKVIRSRYVHGST